MFHFFFIEILNTVLLFAINTSEAKAITLLRTRIQGTEGGKKQMSDANLGIF